MKKYSSSAHHTLTELNITPLLDLAFVLLVIFIITTAPAGNDIELNLPDARPKPKEPPPKINYISRDTSGKIFLNRQEVKDLVALQQLLVEMRSADPDLNIVVRGDSAIPYQQVVDILDTLQQANVTKVGLATDIRTN